MDGGKEAAASAAPAPVPPLLPFDDPWSLRTKPANFEGVVTAGEVVSLNHIRDMQGQRNLYLVREGVKYSCSRDQTDGFKKYLSNLASLLEQEGDRQEMEFEWTSPMAGRSRFYRLSGLRQEQGMATFLYGCLLRELAHQAVRDMLGISKGSTPLDAASDAAAAALAAAVAQLRQAAGVFDFLHTQLLPPLALALKGDRPAELLPETSHYMSLAAQAEAAALTAFRAASKPGASASVVASLQAGAAEVFERAAKVARDYTGDYPITCERMKRYLAINASLATARAHKAMAPELNAQLNAGAASRACVEAESLLATCIGAADIEGGWRGVLAVELADVQRIKAPIESDRLIVYCQPLAAQPAPLPGAKVLVSAVEYVPQHVRDTLGEVALQKM